MSAVVADGSPIIALVQIDRVDILPQLFDTVLLPPQVFRELRAPSRPDRVQAFAGSPPEWIVERAPSSIEPIPGLHPGETAAISLAIEIHAGILLVDEVKGRRAARERGLEITGTVGVLERAAKRGLVNLAESFDHLLLVNFWVSRTLLDEALERHEQWQKCQPR